MSQIAKALQRANYLKPLADSIATIRKAQKYDELLEEKAREMVGAYNQLFSDYGSFYEPITKQLMQIPQIQQIATKPEDISGLISKPKVEQQEQRPLNLEMPARPLEFKKDEIRKSISDRVADIYNQYFSDLSNYRKNLDELERRRALFGEKIASLLLNLTPEEREYAKPYIDMFEKNVNKIIDLAKKPEPEKPIKVDLDEGKVIIGKNEYVYEPNKRDISFQMTEGGKKYQVYGNIVNGNIQDIIKIPIGEDIEAIRERREAIKERKEAMKENEKAEEELQKLEEDLTFTKEKVLSDINDFHSSYNVFISKNKNLYFNPKNYSSDEEPQYYSHTQMQQSENINKLNEIQRQHLNSLKDANINSRKYLIKSGFSELLGEKETRNWYEKIYKEMKDYFRQNPYNAIYNYIKNKKKKSGKEADTKNDFMITSYLFSELILNYDKYKDIFAREPQNGDKK